MTKKAPNYTPEQTREIIAGYSEVLQTKGSEAARNWAYAYADDHDRKRASVVAKLVREEVYEAPARQTKRKAKKADVVRAIAEICNTPDDVIGSLEKATGRALVAVYMTLRQMQDELADREDSHPLESD